MHARWDAALSALMFTAVVAALVVPAGPPQAYAESSVGEQVLSSGDVSGVAAISALGDRLDGVAAAHSIEVSVLEQAFREDPSLHLDGSGRLFYVDPLPPVEAVIAASGDPTTPAALPLESTFSLHSRPGATKVIFLDFDGHVLSSCAWNAYFGLPSPYVCPAFDTDGQPSSFNDAERRVIQEVWQRVSEDYLPFEVDVTTEQPPDDALARSSTADQQYGTRVLITPIGDLDPGAGGRAYLGVFNRVNYEQYKPALVYPDAYSGNPKRIAEAATHEAGHNLYLLHDGTPDREYHAGDGRGWGPLMGAAFSSPLTQWSAGAYAGATSTQDDVAVIAWAGPGYRADDHGDAVSSATTMTAGVTGAAGVIGRAEDVDVLRFSAGGSDTAWLSASPAAVGANLTILLELLDSSGTPIQSARSNSLLSAPTSAVIQTGVLPAGVYYVRISGVANGDPLSDDATDYGSLGAWSLTVNQSPPVVLEPVYRFYNTRLGTHFYTASLTERDRVIASLSHIYTFEGEAYGLNPTNNATPLYRFYNPATGTHFYTASESEKSRVQSTLARVFQYEGPAYAVSLDSEGGTKRTVWRFYNRRTGTHFYTASAGEMSKVKSTLANIYTYEGPAYYLGQ